LTRLCRDWEAAAFVPDSRTVHSIRVRIGMFLSSDRVIHVLASILS
uniref:Threonine-phosphate decarboxylase n=1 Tax=Schistocephalus solidus TaxID=70667 RepID=A0A183SBQ3_SCHSO